MLCHLQESNPVCNVASHVNNRDIPIPHIFYDIFLVYWKRSWERTLNSLSRTEHSKYFPLVLIATDALLLSSGCFHPSYIYYRVQQTHPSLTQSPPAAEAVKNSRIHELIHTCILSSVAHPARSQVTTWIYIYTYIYRNHHHFRGRLVIKFCKKKRGVEPWCITSCQWWHIGGIHASLIDASMGEFFLVYWSLHCYEFRKISNHSGSGNGL